MYEFNKIVTKYYNECSKENNRLQSWEHCYYYFYTNKQNVDADYGALMLFSYLASWGMLRNSFLIEYDYKLHVGLVKCLIENCSVLWNNFDKISWKDIENADNIICKYYEPKKIRNSIGENISSILRTKILLGIFGCVPAYDRFFKNGINIYNKDSNNKIVQLFGENSYNKLVELYKKQPKMEFKMHNYSDLCYPPMKLIDMYFWQIGYENSNEYEKQKRV